MILFLVSISTMIAIMAVAGDNNPAIFRKDVSKTPDAASAKAKLNVMGVWFPVYTADDDPAVIEYRDQEGDLIRTETKAKPLVITYTDVTFAGDGHEYADVFAAVSRDDGNTWKRMNLSRMADKSSFTLANGMPYYGHCKKPVMHVKGNKIFVTWSSKYARGGKPRYAIDTGDDYPYDDNYYTEDIWGVAGSQQSVDYTDYDYNISYPEVGEVPFSVVWCVRGIIATQKDVDKGLGEFVGDIVWFKPERITSGRRDAYQLFAGGSSRGDFGIVWQEDPKGLFPGKGFGPGSGWSGARSNAGTDIWYTYIPAKQFTKVDKNFEAGGDPHHDLDAVKRPKALVPMSLPVRLTDNLGVNTKNTVFYDADGDPIPGTGTNIGEDKEGERLYINGNDGIWCYDPDAEEPYNGFYTYTNYNDEEITAAVTCDGRLLDGDTGASRPNLFLQPYCAYGCTQTPGDTSDDVYSAWAIIGYEETKGAGSGPPEDTGSGGEPQDDGTGNEEYKSDEGKNIHFLSFDFQFRAGYDTATGQLRPMTDAQLAKVLVQDHDILNLQATDLATGDLLWLEDEEGNLVLDIWGEPIPAYQSGKRVRFILQGKSAMGDSKTTLIAVWREAEEGKGKTSDIMLRRNEVTGRGNPYAFKWFQNVQNMSAVTIDETWVDPDHDPSADDPEHDGTKVIRWHQEPGNLSDHTAANPYDDGRAMRGQIRGDRVVMGYLWTPNWYAARNYNDKYDFYIRRSFDGGRTWTTDPDGTGDVEHIDIYQDPTAADPADKHYEVITSYAPGDWEPARNVTRLSSNDVSGLEPRIVATPGTIKKSGVWTGEPEDKQNKKVFYLSYGLEANDETQAPTDMFWSVTNNWGQTLKWVEKEINPGSDSNHAGEIVEVFAWLAKDDDAEEGEAQIRMTPSGERMYACWLEESAKKSDITFRRIMDPLFPVNVAIMVDGFTLEADDATPIPGVEVRLTSDTDDSTLTALSGEDGYFTFEGLSESTYTVSVVGDIVFEEPSMSVALDTDNPNARVRFRKCSIDVGDFDDDCDIDRSDVYVLRPYLNQPASVFPEGDINGDGTINILDMRTLIGMCTCPDCECP
jgi:hypothetical protein